MWRSQLRLMPERTTAPDLYDFGNNIEQWAAKSLDLISQDRFVVVGCSVGGSCALELANLAPDRVAAAILIGTKARCDPDPISHAASLGTVLDKGVAGAWERYWKPLFRNDHASGIAQQAKKIALEQSSEDLICGLDAFYTRKSREHVVMESPFPIHVVTGDRDDLPGLKYSHQLAELSKNARLHVVNDCGHYVPMMQSIALNKLIADVVRDTDTNCAW